MKEREPNELTNQSNSLNLEGIGNFMADGTNQTPEEQHPNQDEAKSGAENRSGQENTNMAKARGEAAEAKKKEEIMARFNMLPPLKQAQIDKVVEGTFANLNNDPDLKILARGEFLPGAEGSLGREGKIGVPESLEDLAKLIIKTSDPKIWGEGGDKALIYKEKKDGEEIDRVNTVNFLDWVRNNMIKVHNFNPTSNVNFFNDLGMSVRNDVYGSMISFYEIVFQESLFLDKKKVDGKEVKFANDDYKLLRDQLLTEVFLFSLMRNGDIAYTTQRGQQKEMLEALTQAFIVNPLTRSNFFEFIFTMPSMHKESIRDLEAGENEVIKAKREGNFYMGDAVRQALSAYMNIFDYGQLQTILGENAVLFRRDYKEWDAEKGMPKTKDGKIVTKHIEPGTEEAKQGFKEEDKRYNKWFNSDGSIKLGKRNPRNRIWEPTADGTGTPSPEYMDYINIFLNPNPDQRQQAEARERMALSIMETNGISYNEAKLAEAWAFSMTHINGVSARNDTQSVAFDWWTRLTNFKDYRKRQKAEKRGASYGGNYNMEGFKRIGLNFFEAARDIRGRTIQDIIQGGQGKNISIEKNPLKNKIDCEKDANGLIVFYDQNDQRIQGLSAKRFDVIKELDQASGKYKSRVRYFDEHDVEVNIGEARSKTVITQVDAPVQFKADLQKQFLPNHMITAAGVYEHIITQAQMNFPEILKGYDTHGNPILDQEKIEKIKKGIEHCIRYSLSTWPEINYADRYVMWERKEVRSQSSGRLIAKKRGLNGEEQELDEDWYILKNGRRTQERNEPETYLDPREMTMLESMFGVDALKFIQFEIEKRGLRHKGKTDDDKGIKYKPETIRGIGFNGVEHEVTVDLSHADEEEFKISVWRGAFDYLVATEIAAHRDRNSGFRWYDSDDMFKVVDVLREGEFVTPDQIGNIQKETRTKLKWLFAQDLSYIFATGGLEGFWKILQIMFKDVVSGK